MSLSNIVNVNSAPPWSNLNVNTINVENGITYNNAWTTFTPLPISGVVSVSDTHSKYTRNGGTITINTDFSFRAESNSDTVIFAGVPNIGSYNSGSVIANALYIHEVSDAVVSFGKYQLNPANSDQFQVVMSEFEADKIYKISGLFVYDGEE